MEFHLKLSLTAHPQDGPTLIADRSHNPCYLLFRPSFICDLIMNADYQGIEDSWYAVTMSGLHSRAGSDRRLTKHFVNLRFCECQQLFQIPVLVVKSPNTFQRPVSLLVKSLGEASSLFHLLQYRLLLCHIFPRRS